MKKIFLFLFILFNTNLAIAKNTNDFIDQKYFNEDITTLLKLKYRSEEDNLIFQNKLFKLKINEQVNFEKRYKILDVIQKNHAFGVTKVDKIGNIKYSGIFGNFNTNSIVDFIEMLNQGKEEIQENVKKVKNYSFSFSKNAKKYIKNKKIKEKDLLKIAKKMVDKKGDLFFFEVSENEKKELMIIAINNKKQVSLSNIKGI